MKQWGPYNISIWDTAGSTTCETFHALILQQKLIYSENLLFR